tara:strand:+ start:6993 stop:9080 length:2088 start_codon:yes stop_codon:yes gene_type:complete
MIRVGVDVGGTFTDIILENQGAKENGVTVTKVPSTPHDQSEGVVKGILQVCDQAEVSPSEIDLLYHGTTVATNMVIERNGAEVGMLTTRGFRDILHMARHKRPHNFSLQYEVPWQSKPLVKRRNRIPITERLMPPTGEIEVAIDENEVLDAAKLLKKRGINSVIVAFLFSFLNNEHELKAKKLIKSVHPEAYVYASSEVVNVIREYERFSSTAMNAYIGPKTASYLDSLKSRLKSNGIGCQVRIMQSNGGISTVENSSDRPIGLLLSGPAGGVIGAKATGEQNDISNIITIDIGGTSADISVIQDGELRIKNPRDTEVAQLPVLVPMLDIDAIGAGGGSIAYIDDGGAFRVGPKSAGAVPGPACYGNGGESPTVTDAQVVLGRLDQEQFLGGDIVINPTLAEKAIKAHIADPLGLSISDAALGILKIINNNMALAINSNSVAKGIDPRGFTLMGFGGAGPLHSVALAEMISARNVISPAQPGITAALGLLVTDLKYEYTRSVLIPLNEASEVQLNGVNKIVAELKKEADMQLDQDKVSESQRKYDYIMECRYLGQGFELRAKMPSEPLTKDNVNVVIDNFYDVHKQQYGHAFKDQITEAITIRVVASVDTEKLEFTKLKAGGNENPDYAQLYSRNTIFDDGQSVSTPRYSREKLMGGDYLLGPAVVTQHNSTTIIPPGYKATMLDAGDILIEKLN